MSYPPFRLTSHILQLVSQIHEVLGELKGFSVAKPSIQLRRANKIRTVHHSLAIEGNFLTEDQVTAILENKRVLGPKTQILEVENALNVYNSLPDYRPFNERHFLSAHKKMMSGLTAGAGKYRSTQVGVFKEKSVSHIAPPARQVPRLMGDLFKFLKNDHETSALIKACIFHYELEFIHPFEDGNGRMGRLWQQVLLMQITPLFEYIAAENIIHRRQREYYKALEECDRAGESTKFIEFSLEAILEGLHEFAKSVRSGKPSASDRISFAIEKFGRRAFSRKDYLDLHQGISTATASRDIAGAVRSGMLIKTGDKSKAVYVRSGSRFNPWI